MNSLPGKKRWYLSLLIPSTMAVLALNHFGFFFKSGSAGSGILIILLLFFSDLRKRTDIWMILIAFLFSIGGDWFLSNRNGDNNRFIAGIALFFIAHLGYLGYALKNGKIRWLAALLILTAYLLFFFIKLAPAINDSKLLISTLLYLLISCLSIGAAIGLQTNWIQKSSYILGISLVLFSDTIIAFSEFCTFHNLNWLILPTYYLAHISITFSLITSQTPNKTHPSFSI